MVYPPAPTIEEKVKVLILLLSVSIKSSPVSCPPLMDPPLMDDTVILETLIAGFIKTASPASVLLKETEPTPIPGAKSNVLRRKGSVVPPPLVESITERTLTLSVATLFFTIKAGLLTDVVKNIPSLGPAAMTVIVDDTVMLETIRFAPTTPPDPVPAAANKDVVGPEFVISGK